MINWRSDLWDTVPADSSWFMLSGPVLSVGSPPTSCRGKASPLLSVSMLKN